MPSVNKVILIGNIGKDPSSRTFENGTKVVSATLATSEKYKKRDGTEGEQTEWHQISVWGKLADIFEKYVKKGSSVYVEGKIKYITYEDKDGNKKYKTDIIVDHLTMLSKGQVSTREQVVPEKELPTRADDYRSSPPPPQEEPMDSLPF